MRNPTGWEKSNMAAARPKKKKGRDLNAPFSGLRPGMCFSSYRISSAATITSSVCGALLAIWTSSLLFGNSRPVVSPSIQIW